MSNSYSAHKEQVESARDKSTGRFGTYDAAESDVSLDTGAGQESVAPEKTAGDYLDSFEAATKDWPGSISVSSDTDSGAQSVTATHYPDMGSENQFRVTHDENDPTGGSRWEHLTDGEVVVSGDIHTPEGVSRAKMHQDAFYGEARAADDYDDAFEQLNDSHGVSVGADFDATLGRTFNELEIEGPDGDQHVVFEQETVNPVAASDAEAFAAHYGHEDFQTSYNVFTRGSDGHTGDVTRFTGDEMDKALAHTKKLADEGR